MIGSLAAPHYAPRPGTPYVDLGGFCAYFRADYFIRPVTGHRKATGLGGYIGTHGIVQGLDSFSGFLRGCYYPKKTTSKTYKLNN